MYTTHDRVMFTRHRRAYVYHPVGSVARLVRERKREEAMSYVVSEAGSFLRLRWR
jgi:hypothetical protein